MLRLAAVVPEDQRARVLALPDVDDRAYRAAVETLIEVQRARLPWADLTLEYLVSVEARVSVATRAKVLRTVLRRFQRAWDEEKPTTVKDLDLSALTCDEETRLTAMAYVVEEALWTNQAPVHLTADVSHLLPGRFIRVLGWANLSSFLPSPLLTLLVTRSGVVEGVVPARYLPIARLLYGHRTQAYGVHLAFAAATLMGELRHGRERNQPSSIMDLLHGTASVLKATFSTYGLTHLSALKPGLHLMDYARSETLRPAQKTRVDQAFKYLLCAEAQLRWCRAHPSPPQVYLDWHLVDVDDTHAAELGRLRNSCMKAGKKRRQQQVKTLEPQLLTLLKTALIRDEVIRGVHEAYLEALELFQTRSGHGPVTFSSVLPDGSATLWFAIWTPNLLSDAEQILVVRAANSHGTMRNSIVTEYLGATDSKGNELSLPFFAEIQRAWYDPAARQAVIKFGIPVSDFNASRSSFLRPDRALGSYIHRYTAAKLSAGQTPRILLDLPAIYTGMTYALFVLIYGLITGMRIHELQQLRADEQGSRRDPDGRLICNVRAKGDKGAGGKDTVHTIEAQFVPFWTRVLTVQEQRGEYLEQVVPENGDLAELGAGRYLLQGKGKALTHKHLAALLRFLIFGVVPLTETERDNFVPHFLRYMYSRTRFALGDDEAAIQLGLGHNSRVQAREYMRGLAGSKSAARKQMVLQPPKLQTYWEALTVARDKRT